MAVSTPTPRNARQQVRTRKLARKLYDRHRQSSVFRMAVSSLVKNRADEKEFPAPSECEMTDVDTLKSHTSPTFGIRELPGSDTFGNGAPQKPMDMDEKAPHMSYSESWEEILPRIVSPSAKKDDSERPESVTSERDGRSSPRFSDEMSMPSPSPIPLEERLAYEDERTPTQQSLTLTDETATSTPSSWKGKAASPDAISQQEEETLDRISLSHEQKDMPTQDSVTLTEEIAPSAAAPNLNDGHPCASQRARKMTMLQD